MTFKIKHVNENTDYRIVEYNYRELPFYFATPRTLHRVDILGYICENISLDRAHGSDDCVVVTTSTNFRIYVNLCKHLLEHWYFVTIIFNLLS